MLLFGLPSPVGEGTVHESKSTREGSRSVENVFGSPNGVADNGARSGPMGSDVCFMVVRVRCAVWKAGHGAKLIHGYVAFRAEGLGQERGNINGGKSIIKSATGYPRVDGST